MTQHWDIVSLAIATIITVLALGLEHWFPYIGRLARLQAYTVGTLTLWAGFALWRLLNGDWVTPAGLAIICLSGGLAVIVGYWIDKQVDRIRRDRNKVKMIEAADDTLKR